MKGGFDELAEWERWMKRLAKGLEGGEDFLKARAPAYRETAEAVGRQVLMGMRPPGEDEAEWRQKVAEFAEFLGWKAVTKGFEIFYRKYEEGAPGHGNVEINYKDVLAWVNAGPEAGGKNKSASEIADGMENEEIAHVVNRAINQYRFGFVKDKDYGPITDRLEEWVMQKFLSADLGKTLAAVLEAWVMAIGPMVEQDFSDWIDRELRKA